MMAKENAVSKIIRTNVADWHANKACKAYLDGVMEVYLYHIAIADRFRA
jgi:hypothetical protein